MEAEKAKSPQEQEWLQWWRGQKAVELKRHLAKLKELTKEQWARKEFQGDNPHECVARNAFALGGIQVLDDLLALEFSDIYSEEGEQV